MSRNGNSYLKRITQIKLDDKKLNSEHRTRDRFHRFNFYGVFGAF